MLLEDKAPMAFPIFKDQLINISKSGQLLDIKPYLSLMPNYLSLSNPQHLDGFTIDGKLYALPGLSMKGSSNGSNVKGWAIRKDWLNNVSLDLPRNLEELEEVLKRFTYGDPNMNGVDDTIGLSIDPSCSIIWGAYGLPYVDNNSWILINNQNMHISTLLEAKQVLLLLRRWYSLGYINLDGFYKNSQKILESGSTGITLISVWSLTNVRTKLRNEGIPNAVQMLPAIEGPFGSKGYPISSIPNNALALNSSMTKSETLSMVKFLDWMVDISDSGGFMKTTYGQEGVHYTQNKDTGEIKVLNYNRQISDGYSNPIRFIPVTDRRWVSSGPLLNDLAILNNNQDLLYNNINVNNLKEFYYFTNFIWPNLFLGIITGETELEEWEKYREEFNKRVTKR